jgi:tetratricopeptide (TPR) repeat protein
MADGKSVRYDVFISHRGPDTKKNFAILLKAALQKQQIVAFHDDKDLVPGCAAPAGLQAAMEGADLGIVILSPRFFESKCCMEELDFFLRAGCALPVLVELTADSCKAESVIERSGRAWETCGMKETEWRDILRRLQGIAMLGDGYWDKCQDEVVRLTAERLGRPAPSTGARVNTVPYMRNDVNFLGRDDKLEELSAVLGDKKRACVAGMGGMGKTQLALEYAYRYELHYASILWVDADLGVIRDSYLKLASCLGIDLGSVREGPVANDPVTSVRSHLEEHMGGPYLLVFDNVEDEAGFAGNYMPRRGPCHVIVTTRLSGIRQLSRIELGALQKEDALKLARGAQTFDEQEEASLEVLAARFGYLTLALAVSSQLFTCGYDYRPSKLLEDLDRKGPQIFAGELEDPVFRKHPDLVRLFQTSFDMLLRDIRANDAEKLLAQQMAWVGGWFAPSPIRKDLLATAACRLAGIEDGPKSKERSEATVEQAAAASEAADEDQIRGAVRLLLRYALVYETISNREGMMSFHVLVQSFCKWKGGPNAGVAMAFALIEVGKVKEEKDHFENAFRLTFPEEPRASSTEIRLERADKSGYFSEEDFISSVGMRLVEENMLFGNQLEEAKRILKRCVARLSDSLEHYKTRIDSEEFQQSILEASSPEAQPHRKQALENFNKWFVKMAGLDAGLRALRNQLELPSSKALEILEQEVGLHDRAAMWALRNQRALMLQSEGQVDEAEVLFTDIVAYEEKERGPDNPEVATALQSLASNLRFQGRQAEAEPILWRVWEIRIEALGPWAPETASSLINLAFVVHAQGQHRHAEAETLLRQALVVVEDIGAHSEETALAARFLALLLMLEGRCNEAEPFAKQALEIMERGVGSDHPDVVEYRDLYNSPLLAPFKQPAATPMMAPFSTPDFPVAADQASTTEDLPRHPLLSQPAALFQGKIAIDHKRSQLLDSLSSRFSLTSAMLLYIFILGVRIDIVGWEDQTTSSLR